MVERTFDNDDACRFYNLPTFNRPRPSAVLAERNALLNADTEFRLQIQALGSFESILGKIHLEMCKYHELGQLKIILARLIDHFDSKF
jgi:hypothetical protein